ncbi:arsenic transporter [Pseudoclavibacter sp. RFBJ3]|uniref:SLC13 family permease n=1 Tax=unclassified Pseudoclavibacter TaxID=2615177 RepID=UPI000CE8D4C3|nr:MULTISPECIES: SLC13 family permease [unclassified Pseudoclavibacter]PPF81715.1 arsenic transporter [Pseudoclavibacter sp. RFBJ5]PPF91045.1 arsenic transporter [Pseudoclavibacter sp. RFBJ3]PPG00321.1 arsenic transporter [Pseudoclavibacter sp. RFBH5]PPG19336.1 arsenic transporter [Pseudoclavibacter sp. RFBI4]
MAESRVARVARVAPIIATAVLVVAAVVVAAIGVLPAPELLELGERVVPVLAFVVGITIVAELASDAGVFSVLADRLAKLGRGRLWLLWTLVLLLATVSTAFLSLDTTAVLVTPVVVLLAVHVGVSPIPFALATVWLANTASLFLPVSNLTSLLAARSFEGGPLQFLAITWAPALVGVLASAAILSFVFRRELDRRYRMPTPTSIHDRPLLIFAAVVTALLLPALVTGVEVAIPAGVAALLLIVAFAVRRRGALRFGLVPWQALGIAGSLFVLVEAAHAHGLSELLAAVSGSGDDPLSLLQLSAIGAASANGINNLPAYLALEPVADSPARLVALLIGVNLGPLVTPWASLATLLWHERLVALGVTISWLRFVALGLAGVAIIVPLATLALAATI